MARKKRPSMKDMADMVQSAVPAQGRSEPITEQEAPQTPHRGATDQPQIEFRKFTAPLDDDLLRKLNRLLAEWADEKRVKFSIAEVLRLGMIKVYDLMQEDPDQAILELYERELIEQAASPNRKYGRSKGAEQYLKNAGKI